MSALALACAHEPLAPSVPPSFALNKRFAAEVCMPQGEQLFLSRLRCPDGKPVLEVSSEGAGPRTEPENPNDPRMLKQLDVGLPLAPGEPDFHLVDKVIVSCHDGDHALYLDMYHCLANPPVVAPHGFTIQPLPAPP